jgi:prepilin-type N-terminal cleavage/methylation domain-containing protein
MRRATDSSRDTADTLFLIFDKFALTELWHRHCSVGTAVGGRQLSGRSNNINRLRQVHAANQMKGKRMRRKFSRRGGFTLVEIMIVVAIIGLLAAIAVPNFIKARSLSQKNACIENLRQIFGAKHSWALETKKAATDVPQDSDLFGSNLYIRAKPECPAAGTYTLDQIDAKPSCSIPEHSL